jgi:hypothetical protein
MKLINKCLNQIADLKEVVISEPEYRGKKVRAKLKIDLSDESNLTRPDPYREGDEYFYMVNKHNLPTNLKRVEVKIDDDDSAVEEGEGQEPYNGFLPLFN